MSRREEVEKVIAESYRSSYLPPLEEFARTLADEVDALRAELRRVKAESLRVVPDGEAFDIDDLPGWEHIINDLYTHDGRTYINIDDERCYKVRLERWETEDGN